MAPKSASVPEAPAPVVVFFYGGGFLEGAEEWYHFVGAAFAKRGIVVAIPDSVPINRVTPGAPPMLLLASRAGSAVGPGNTNRLAATLRLANVPVTVKLYAGITHAAIMAAMSTTLAFLAPVQAEAVRLIAEHPACVR